MQKYCVLISAMLFMANIIMAQSEAVSEPAAFFAASDYSKIPVTVFVKSYVESNINAWQQKGEFERTADYQARVNEQTRNAKAQELTNEALAEYKKIYSKSITWNKLTLGRYDADNETYLIMSDQLGNFAMKVPIADAPKLRENWDKVKFQNPDFYVQNESLLLAKLEIVTPDGKKLSYDSQQPTLYSATNINYNFKPIEVEVPQDGVQKNETIIETHDISVGKSDVAVNIPVNPQTNHNTFVLIIANENYRREVKVAYAINDGSTFKEYCEKTLGIPSKNIHFSKDATFGEMRSELNWLTEVLKAYNGEAKAIVYYAGHGMPKEDDKTAYLLPVDGFSSDFETAIKLETFYGKISENPAQQVVVFLDACFSGSQRGDGMLAEARGVSFVPKKELISGNMVVISAASGSETAYPYKEKQHGMFTYFLLKKMQETKGNVSLNELSEYITTQVSRQSIVVNQKSQTPQVMYADTMKDIWKNITLK
jgi:hypothetical protein